VHSDVGLASADNFADVPTTREGSLTEELYAGGEHRDTRSGHVLPDRGGRHVQTQVRDQGIGHISLHITHTCLRPVGGLEGVLIFLLSDSFHHPSLERRFQVSEYGPLAVFWMAHLVRIVTG
jgi:hypothetical protein